MRAIKTGDPEDKLDKKEKRQARRANRKAERALNPFNQPPKTRRGDAKGSSGLFDDGLSGGGCKDGNNRDVCPEVQTTTSGKAPKFNPNKSRLSKKKLVKAKKEKQPEQSNQERYSNPRFL